MRHRNRFWLWRLSTIHRTDKFLINNCYRGDPAVRSSNRVRRLLARRFRQVAG